MSIKRQNILLTGGGGYLASALAHELNNNNTIVKYPGDVREYTRYSDIDTVIHFASLSDRREFMDADKTASTIIEGSINMIRIARENKCKVIYASTLGVLSHGIDDVYCTCKLAIENYIRSVYNNYVILRIPRVYSKCRQKGLMRGLHENKIPERDMDEMIEYITLQNFVDQTLPILELTNVTHEYEITQKKSIREIKQWIKIS